MGQVLDGTGKRIELAGRHRVGRDPWSDLVIADPAVSGSHALLLWDGQGWSVRDLGSRNGTVVDGAPIEVGAPVPLGSGARVTLGGCELTLVDPGPPRPMITGPSGTMLLDGALGVPGADGVFVVPGDEGDWWIDDGVGRRPLCDRQVFEAAGQRWTAHLEGALPPTREDRVADGGPLLRFRVSLDEEHVDLWVRTPDASVAIPSRAHHYTLVTLARQVLADRAAGIDDADVGWVATQTLCQQLRLQRGAVYTHLYRARKQLTEAGFPGLAERLVEHRTEATQLRLGLTRLEVRDA